MFLHRENLYHEFPSIHLLPMLIWPSCLLFCLISYVSAKVRTHTGSNTGLPQCNNLKQILDVQKTCLIKKTPEITLTSKCTPACFINFRLMAGGRSNFHSTASIPGAMLIRLSEWDHRSSSDEWAFISLSVWLLADQRQVKWSRLLLLLFLPLRAHQSQLGRRTPLCVIDLLASRPSQCSSCRASWWGVAPARRTAAGTRRTPCDRGILRVWATRFPKWVHFPFYFAILAPPSAWDLSGSLTLPVDPQSIKQLGAPQLSAEQSCIQLHQTQISRLPLRLTFPAFEQGSAQSLEGIRLGQHAVNKVDPGPPQHIKESVLEERGCGVRADAGGIKQLVAWLLETASTQTV